MLRSVEECCGGELGCIYIKCIYKPVGGIIAVVDATLQLAEVRTLLPYRHLSTLRTVGYRELFPVLDGTRNLDDAVAEIKLNTWHYARKQQTWCRRYM